MADIDTSGGGGHGKRKGGIRSKKVSTRVDLTPMVDLAFLLITFFILTTTLNKPRAMELTMPKTDSSKVEIGDCQVLNILLDTLDRIWYYEGLQLEDLRPTTLSSDGGIGEVIRDKMKKVNAGCQETATGKRRE